MDLAFLVEIKVLALLEVPLSGTLLLPSSSPPPPPPERMHSPPLHLDVVLVDDRLDLGLDLGVKGVGVSQGQHVLAQLRILVLLISISPS